MKEGRSEQAWPLLLPEAQSNEDLGARPLLLAAEERVQGDVGDLADLEPDAGDVADGVALPAEPAHQHLVVLLHEVETTVIGHEGRDLLAVLDQLHTDALPL